MIDKEIIQAQRICFRDLDDGAACPNCPLYGNENCLAEVMGGAADLLEWLSGASADLRKEIEWKDMVIALAQRKQAEAEAERDALQEKQRWIPVTERMPNTIPCNAGTEYSEAVIVWTTGNKAMIAVWDGIDFICPTDFWEAWGEEITHWMPLPGAPEGCFNQRPTEVVPEDHKRREKDRGAQDAPKDEPAV